MRISDLKVWCIWILDALMYVFLSLKGVELKQNDDLDFPSRINNEKRSSFEKLGEIIDRLRPLKVQVPLVKKLLMEF